ncbi:MAG: dienelactone hydrolase family protein [Pseudomonadota bacterium]
MALFALAACATGRSDIDELGALLEPGYRISKPDGPGPFPAALLYHGCGGLVGEAGDKDIMDGYVAAATEAGYVAIVVDSLRPRNIDFDEAVSRVCRGLKLRGQRRAGDVVASAAYARDLPYTKETGAVLAGWSHGGWAVMEAMAMDLTQDWPPGLQRPETDALASVAGVYLTYPYCGFPARTPNRDWPRAPRASVLLVENDTVAKREPCDKAFARMQASGVKLDLEVFDGVTHAFDESDHTDDSEFVYDGSAAKRAHERFGAFLSSLID